MPFTREADQRRLDMPQLELPGTPQELWDVMATARGMAAWLVPGEVEERKGGGARFQLGPGKEGTATVSVWEPPRRFAYDEPGWSGDAPPLTTEIVIQPRPGTRCGVNISHILNTAEERWDEHLKGLEAIWPPFFDILRLYLTHHRGLPAATIHALGNHSGPPEQGTQSLLQALSLTGAEVGARRNTGANGAPEIEGVVDRIDPVRSSLILHFDKPCAGVGLFGTSTTGGTAQTYLRVYYYSRDAAQIAKREGARWNDWMMKHFPRR